MFLSRLHDSPLPQLRKTLSKSSSKAERSSALPNYRTGDKSHRLANVVVFVVQAVLLTKVVTSVVVAVVEVCVFLCSRCGGWYVHFLPHAEGSGKPTQVSMHACANERTHAVVLVVAVVIVADVSFTRVERNEHKNTRIENNSN